MERKAKGTEVGEGVVAAAQLRGWTETAELTYSQVGVEGHYAVSQFHCFMSCRTYRRRLCFHGKCPAYRC